MMMTTITESGGTPSWVNSLFRFEDAPEFINRRGISGEWLAKDRDGEWWWYDVKPRPNLRLGLWEYDRKGGAAGAFPADFVEGFGDNISPTSSKRR